MQKPTLDQQQSKNEVLQNIVAATDYSVSGRSLIFVSDIHPDEPESLTLDQFLLTDEERHEYQENLTVFKFSGSFTRKLCRRMKWYHRTRNLSVADLVSTWDNQHLWNLTCLTCKKNLLSRKAD